MLMRSLGKLHFFTDTWSRLHFSLPTPNTVLCFIRPTLLQYFNIVLGTGIQEIIITFLWEQKKCTLRRGGCLWIRKVSSVAFVWGRDHVKVSVYKRSTQKTCPLVYIQLCDHWLTIIKFCLLFSSMVCWLSQQQRSLWRCVIQTCLSRGSDDTCLLCQSMCF